MYELVRKCNGSRNYASASYQTSERLWSAILFLDMVRVRILPPPHGSSTRASIFLPYLDILNFDSYRSRWQRALNRPELHLECGTLHIGRQISIGLRHTPGSHIVPTSTPSETCHVQSLHATRSKLVAIITAGVLTPVSSGPPSKC
jgi:hypothetical protein